MLASFFFTHSTRAQGFLIPASAYVIQSNGNIVTAANWSNSGSFTQNGGTLVFAGTTQSLGGSSATVFNSITVLSGSTTTVSAASQQVSGSVLSNGTFNANGNLTLLSTATQTAFINGSGTGQVTGNLTMQRYLPSGFGYRYLSSPFQADTVGDLGKVITLGSSFPPVYSYNEALSSAGWVNYSTSANTLTPFQGYAANFGSSTAALTFGLTGVVNNQPITNTLYNHNNTYTLGFNLMGNPYPSVIDWNASAGWTKTNIDNAIYFFSNGTADQYAGTYSSYVNGVSSNGIASNLIAAMQGFFVHVTNGTYPVTGTLTINNNARNTLSTTTFFGIPLPGGTPPLLRLTAAFEDADTTADPAVFYFKTQAPGNFDKELDALKLMNSRTGVPSLYSLSNDFQRLSIYALSNSFDTLLSIPLGLKTLRDGWLSVQARDLDNLPGNLYLYLTDKQTGTNTDLRQGTPYRLFLPTGQCERRLWLSFSTKPLSPTPPNTSNLFSTWYSGGNLYINSNLPPGETGDLVIYTLLGQALFRQQINGPGIQPVGKQFLPGIYVLTLRTRQQSQSIKVLITPP